MIKRTIDISQGPTYLSVENDQLVISRDGQPVGRAPCEDIGVLLIDHYATTYTQSVFTRLAHHGAVIIICGADHLPATIALPMQSNELTARRLRLQAAAPAPLRKRLWKQIVAQKVRLQAQNLPIESAVRRRLIEMANDVSSGDRSNIEGQAARFYWPAMFGAEFRRNPDGPPPNNLLNYGHMVLRASIARALVAAGLHPVFSLQHSHRHNSFALADDLIEVLRPRVDQVVLQLARSGQQIIDRVAKAKLLGILAEEVTVGDLAGPLMVQLHRVATSLLRCYEGEAKRMELPLFSAQTVLAQPPSRDTASQ